MSAYAPGDLIADKYQLDRMLGEGGMGTVWLARNLALGLPVAVKLIRSDLDRRALGSRLRKEARAAARLGHPAIVAVFDVGETAAGDPFIVMEHLDGQTIAELIQSEGQLDAGRAVQLLLPIADALAAAHAKGIVHRDVKPANVLIATKDARVQPKLVDFGIALLDDHHGEQPATTVLGSPDYLSPEQATGDPDVDHRTDIWSFCVVLYEAITGRVPFQGASHDALLRSIVEAPPECTPRWSEVDDALRRIVERGLEKEREARWASMAELGEALASWLVEQGIHEDVCGTSLHAKWLVQSGDAAEPSSRRPRPQRISAEFPLTKPVPTPGAAFEAFDSAITLQLPRRRRPPLVLVLLALLVTAGAVLAVVTSGRSSPPALAPATHASTAPVGPSETASTTTPSPSSAESGPVLHVDDLVTEPETRGSVRERKKGAGAAKDRPGKQPQPEPELMAPY